MIQRMDDFLIDRVFQPISDALARWISCYGIAAFLLTGACLFQGGAFVYRREWFWLLIASAWFPLVIHKAHEMDKALPSNVMVADRLTGRWVRLLLLIGQCLFLPRDIMSSDAPVHQVESATWWGVIAAYYFMACYKRPAKPKRAKVPTAIMEGAR